MLIVCEMEVDIVEGVRFRDLADKLVEDYRRAYSFADIVAAYVAGRFRRNGLTLEGLRHIVAYVQRNRALKDPPADAQRVVQGKSLRVIRGDYGLLKAFRQASSHDALVIDVGRTAEEIRCDLEGAAV